MELSEYRAKRHFILERLNLTVRQWRSDLEKLGYVADMSLSTAIVGFREELLTLEDDYILGVLNETGEAKPFRTSGAG